jgi:hypothetical protein
MEYFEFVKYYLKLDYVFCRNFIIVTSIDLKYVSIYWAKEIIGIVDLNVTKY